MIAGLVIVIGLVALVAGVAVLYTLGDLIDDL